MRTTSRIFSSLIFAVAFLASVHADAAGEPKRVTLKPVKATGVILTVGGRAFTLPELEALGTYEVTTNTFWPGDNGTYQGVMLAKVLKAAEIADAPTIKISASDGFAQTMPKEDWNRFDVLLATRRDGKPLDAKSKGPTRIIYPRDSNKLLEKSIYEPRWVWQVTKIEAVRQ